MADETKKDASPSATVADRSAEFQAVEGGGDTTSSTTLVVAAYSFIWFAAFAFIVLLGTVFPLVVEALQTRRISVGRPYFERMTMPVGIAMLFLMAVAPALPWRKASGELLRTRLEWPA